MSADTLFQEPESPQIAIEDEMKKSYLDYAMSVIVSRALPDIRDGLKPVHRRILYAMKEGGYDSSKPYRKSARIVGDVMGKYHPHGDSAIYDSLVRMAQEFSLRLPLIDGQGNFGSMDGDNAAAMRYTEARLAKAGEAILEDYDKDTVDFIPNYDDSDSEPSVLPSRVPNLLVNGAGGIAVGMATNIPPHNLGEVIDGCMALIDNADITSEELMEFIPGPDYPTGAVIMGRSAIRSAYLTGNGSVRARARSHIEEIKGNREAIVIDDMPYQVNKAKMLEKIGELVRNKEIEGISEARDESSREGVRVVIELRKDVNADVMLNKLYKSTQLQNNFPCNMLALVGGRPQVCVLKDFIAQFIKFREQVITRRTAYELNKARDKSHLLIGLSVAVANIDEVIKLIREAKDPTEAREELMARDWKGEAVAPMIALIDDPTEALNDKGVYKLSETQARGILDLKLHRLTGLERDKILDDLKLVVDAIRGYLDILSDRNVLLALMKEELSEIKEKFATPRRTEITESEDEMDIEDLIQREDMVVTITHGGYVKRVPLNVYRAQRRGGKGRNAMSTKDDDFVSDIFVASTHTPIVFFTTRGRAFQMKVYQLPLGSATSRGKAMVNLLPLTKDENVGAYIRMPEDKDLCEKLDIVFATSSGSVRRNKLTDFTDIRQSGIIAMKLPLDDKMVGATICRGGEDIMLASRLGKAIRFKVEDLRVFSSRASIGVRGIKLTKGDEVISLSVLNHSNATPEERVAYLKHSAQLRASEASDDDMGELGDATSGDEGAVEDITLSAERIEQMQANDQFLLTVTTKGFGKRTSAYDYRITNRAGRGVTNVNLTKKNGEVVATFPVTSTHQLLLVTDGGQMIRIPTENIRITSRATQGVTLFKVAKDEQVVSVAWLKENDEEADGDEENTNDGTADLLANALGDAPEETSKE